MTLTAGTQLGHYETTAQLGAGGMGEVRLAKTRGSTGQVAFKAIPPEFTQDADRLRRFMQEAKAASTLNHPNIITDFVIGKSRRVARKGYAAHSSFSGGQEIAALECGR